MPFRMNQGFGAKLTTIRHDWTQVWFIGHKYCIVIALSSLWC
jgi:hypothetical protein